MSVGRKRSNCFTIFRICFGKGPPTGRRKGLHCIILWFRERSRIRPRVLKVARSAGPSDSASMANGATLPAAETGENSRRMGSPAWIQPELLAELDGRLWHATSERGYAGIVADGAIRPDSLAIYHNGFCRSIGAVSLFDLAAPDEAASAAATHWSAWLGALDDEFRFWIEIDRSATASDILDPRATLDRWRSALDAGSTSLRIISGIEAAHLGRIPLAKTLQVLRIRRGHWLRH